MTADSVRHEAAPEQLGAICGHPSGATPSLAEVEAVVAAVQHPVIVCGERGDVVSMNPAALALHGFESVEECLGTLRDSPELLEGRDAAGRSLAPEEWPVARAARGERVHRLELHGRRRDTGARWVGLYSVSRLLTSGGDAFFIAAVEDVTERRRAEQALREGTTLLRAVCDTSADLVYAKDRDGRMLLANPATLAVVGRPEREVLGKTDLELLRDEAVAREVMEHDRRIMERGLPEVLEEMVPDSSGAPRVWHSTKAPYRDADGNIVGVLGISSDITARRRAEEALRESEERYRTLFTHMAEGFALGEAVCDEGGAPCDFRFLEMNDAFEAQTGLRRADVQGRRMTEVLPKMERSWVERYCGVALSGEPLRFESYNRDLDRHWTVVCYSPAKGRFATIFSDVSDLKRKEEERTRLLASLRGAAADAERSRAQLEAIIESMSDGVIVFDTAGSVVLVNRAAAEIDGYGSAPPARRDLASFAEAYALAEPDGRPLAPGLCPASRILRGEAIADWELRAHRRDTGQERFLSFSGAPVRDEHGNPILAVVITRDVTARRRADEALREADRRKDEFLAVLAHELRNPLAPIRNALDVVERAAPGGDQARRALGAIGRQVTHLARLVDDLLDVSRITRGKIDLQHAPLELRDLASRTADDYRALFAQVGVELAVTAPETSVWVSGDVTRLAQVIGNLLHNAARFTPARGRVTVAIETAHDKARLRVRDTGTGIDASVRQRLFQPFAQADRTLERSRGGLGLGLALVRGLVELHGGSVDARDVEGGGGAEFVVELPLLAGVRTADEPSVTSPPPSPLRVLVVEDNEDAADMLRVFLELEGHVVEVAADGNEGISRACSFVPDVVLCDIGLPGKSGYDVARELRAEPRLAHALLVAVTGYAGRADVQRAREAGFDHHVPKPADVEVLTRLLASAAGAAASA